MRETSFVAPLALIDPLIRCSARMVNPEPRINYECAPLIRAAVRTGRVRVAQLTTAMGIPLVAVQLGCAHSYFLSRMHGI